MFSVEESASHLRHAGDRAASRAMCTTTTTAAAAAVAATPTYTPTPTPTTTTTTTTTTNAPAPPPPARHLRHACDRVAPAAEDDAHQHDPTAAQHGVKEVPPEEDQAEREHAKQGARREWWSC